MSETTQTDPQLSNEPPIAILTELATLRNIAQDFIKSVDSLEQRLGRLQSGLEQHLTFLGEDVSASQKHATDALDAIQAAAKLHMDSVQTEVNSKSEAGRGAMNTIERMLKALKGTE